MEAVASAASASLPVSMQDPTPLSRILPYVLSSLTLLKYVAKFAWSIIQWTLTTLSPLPVLVYVLSPLTFFLELCASVFIISPYKAILYGLEALQPLYVFCGVACITGGILGVTGRWMSGALVRWAESEGGEVENVVLQGVKPGQEDTVDRGKEEDEEEESEEETYDEAAERIKQEKKRAKERLWFRRRSSSELKGKGKPREHSSYPVKKEY